eukprot:8850534-Pyramimonas_sp.AAC.1
MHERPPHPRPHRRRPARPLGSPHLHSLLLGGGLGQPAEYSRLPLQVLPEKGEAAHRWQVDAPRKLAVLALLQVLAVSALGEGSAGCH